MNFFFNIFSLFAFFFLLVKNCFAVYCTGNYRLILDRLDRKHRKTMFQELKGYMTFYFRVQRKAKNLPFSVWLMTIFVGKVTGIMVRVQYLVSIR